MRRGTRLARLHGLGLLLGLLAGCPKPQPPPPDPELLAALASTGPDRPQAERRMACVKLGQLGGTPARERLLALLGEASGDADRDGWIRLYAAVGLSLLRDPGTAVDLVLNLSKVNPNDSLAARASPERDDEYFTIDAQICDALLAMGLWDAEESLLEQLGRRHRVRVAIDAAATLRRRTGLNLPFRYNGSYAQRDADAAAWATKLRSTRADRRRRRPFDAGNPRFQSRLSEVVGWLRGASINDRYIAEKALLLIGAPAVPALARLLEEPSPQGQREAALVLGRIGDPSVAPALQKALALPDAKARARAVEALRQIGAREALADVRARLADEDDEVRAQAARFLGRLGGAEDVRPLREAIARERIDGARLWMGAALLLRRAGSADEARGWAESILSRREDDPDRAAALEELRLASPGISGGADAESVAREFRKS